MLTCFNMTNATTASTPLNTSLPLIKAQPTNKCMNIMEYQELISSLNHPAVFSHPDISYTISQLSQFLTNPFSIHLTAAR